MPIYNWSLLSDVCYCQVRTLVQFIHHCHLTLEVMVFIICKQHTGLILFTKYTPFALHGIVGKVNNNVLLVQTMLY